MPVSTDRARSADRCSPTRVMLLPLAASPSPKVPAVRSRLPLLSTTGVSIARCAGRRFCAPETAASSRDRLRRRTIECRHPKSSSPCANGLPRSARPAHRAGRDLGGIRRRSRGSPLHRSHSAPYSRPAVRPCPRLRQCPAGVACHPLWV